MPCPALATASHSRRCDGDHPLLSVETTQTGCLSRGCAYHYASQDAVHHMVSVKMLCVTRGSFQRLCMTGGVCPEAVHDRGGSMQRLCIP